MPLYTYKAIDSKGKQQTGSAEAPTHESLGETLKAKGLFLMEAKLAAPRRPPEPPGPAPRSSGSQPPARSVPLNALVVFTSEFSIMLRTGFPLNTALNVLTRQQKHPELKRVIAELDRSIQQGKSLSSAFSQFPRVFDSIYTALLSSGEAGGNVPAMLERLSAYLTFRRELRSKIQSALLYPLMIMLTGMGVALFLVLFILPNFAAMFAQMQTELPLPTRMLLGFSQNLRTWWWLYGLAAAAAALAARVWLAVPANALAVERLQLRLPVVGQLIRNIVMTRILRTLGALVAGGVPILESLKLAGKAASHAVFYHILERVHKNASEGKGLATALTNDPFFPIMAADMIANAELTGTLPEVMSQISDYYEKETDRAIRNVFALIEPLFVVLIGLMVGAIAVCILLPIFQMDQAIG